MERKYGLDCAQIAHEIEEEEDLGANMSEELQRQCGESRKEEGNLMMLQEKEKPNKSEESRTNRCLLIIESKWSYYR